MKGGRASKSQRVPAGSSQIAFHSRNATGKAGERLVETFVEEKLGFVYRRVDQPDIGIDGEIETLDASLSSTGGFLKVQVKTTKEAITKARFKVPFDEKHLDYFDALTVPPILAVVSLADRMIWWKPILHKENYRGPRGGFGIPIDTVADKLTTASGHRLRMIGERSNAMIARYLVEEVEQRLQDIDDAEAGGDWDIVTVEAWADRIREMERSMREAACLLRYERRYSAEISGIEKRFAHAKDAIQMRKAWFEDYDVGDLLAEPRWGDDR